jgi:hypothetical protein
MNQKRAHLCLTICGLCMLQAAGLMSTISPAKPSQLFESRGPDKHYIDVGFFDIHLCNWPKPGVFYLALFSTEVFDEIERIEIFYPDEEKMGELDLARFRLIPADPATNQREKRVFMANFQKRDDNPDGWFYALVTRRDGVRYVARDLVTHSPMERASGQVPPPSAEGIPMPTELRWTPISGAGRYKVFIKDAFLEQIIYESALLDSPVLALPDGLLEKGGAYLWQVHARDVDGHVELGDFNAGSLSDFIGFSVAE